MTPDAPHNCARHPPRGAPSRHPQSAQRRLARAQDLGPVLGSVPHAHTARARDTRATGPDSPPPGAGGQERDSA